MCPVQMIRSGYPAVSDQRPAPRRSTTSTVSLSRSAKLRSSASGSSKVSRRSSAPRTITLSNSGSAPSRCPVNAVSLCVVPFLQGGGLLFSFRERGIEQATGCLIEIHDADWQQRWDRHPAFGHGPPRRLNDFFDSIRQKLIDASQQGVSFRVWAGRLNLRRYAPLGRCRPKSRPSKVNGWVLKAVM
jgi:hypothetical protein